MFILPFSPLTFKCFIYTVWYKGDRDMKIN